VVFFIVGNKGLSQGCSAGPWRPTPSGTKRSSRQIGEYDRPHGQIGLDEYVRCHTEAVAAVIELIRFFSAVGQGLCGQRPSQQKLGGAVNIENSNAGIDRRLTGSLRQ